MAEMNRQRRKIIGGRAVRHLPDQRVEGSPRPPFHPDTATPTTAGKLCRGYRIRTRNIGRQSRSAISQPLQTNPVEEIAAATVPPCALITFALPANRASRALPLAKTLGVGLRAVSILVWCHYTHALSGAARIFREVCCFTIALYPCAKSKFASAVERTEPEC